MAAAAANGQPVPADQVLVGLAFVAILAFLVSLYDDEGAAARERTEIGAEIDELPVVRRRDVARIITARRWR